MSKNGAAGGNPTPMDAPSTFNIPTMTLASITGSHGQAAGSASTASATSKKSASAKLRFDESDSHGLEQDTPEERQQRILQRRLRIDQNKANAQGQAGSSSDGCPLDATNPSSSSTDDVLSSSTTKDATTALDAKSKHGLIFFSFMRIIASKTILTLIG